MYNQEFIFNLQNYGEHSIKYVANFSNTKKKHAQKTCKVQWTYKAFHWNAKKNSCKESQSFCTKRPVPLENLICGSKTLVFHPARNLLHIKGARENRAAQSTAVSDKIKLLSVAMATAVFVPPSEAERPIYLQPLASALRGKHAIRFELLVFTSLPCLNFTWLAKKKSQFQIMASFLHNGKFWVFVSITREWWVIFICCKRLFFIIHTWGRRIY